MRKPLHTVSSLVVTGMLALTVVPSSAQRAERELLGIRIWNNYADVMRKHGQPTRIESGLVTSSGDAGQTVAAGMPGMPSMPGMGGMGGRPGMPAMMGSGGGMGGGMSIPGMMGSGGGGGKMGVMMGMMGGGGSGGGMPGMPSMPGMPGMGGAPGMPGMGGGIGTQGNDESEARQTWIYQRGPITNYFVFNDDGRVVQIESSGLSGRGGVTARGVTLGDPVQKVYRAYGWTGKVSKNGPAVLLDYSRASHAAFVVQDLKGRGPVVVDIAVTLLNVGPPSALGSGSAVAGGPGMPGMGGMGGRPGMPAMMGSGGMGMPGMMGPGGRPGMPGMMGPGGMGGARGRGRRSAE